MLNQLDHIICGSPSIETVAQRLTDTLGVMCSATGTHPDLGTVNALLRIEQNVYLELLASGRTGANASAQSLKLSKIKIPELIGFVVRTDSLDEMAHHAARIGVDASPSVHGHRIGQDGELVSWRYMFLRSASFPNMFPLMIDWHTTPHPTLQLAENAVRSEFSIEHPDAVELNRLYRELELPVEAVFAPAPCLRLMLSTSKGSVQLCGPAETEAQFI